MTSITQPSEWRMLVRFPHVGDYVLVWPIAVCEPVQVVERDAERQCVVEGPGGERFSVPSYRCYPVERIVERAARAPTG